MTDPASSLWTPPEPRELPALREELAEQMRNPFEHQGLRAMLSLGRGTHSPRTGDFGRDATILLEEERARLTGATLFYVTADLTRLAVAAARTLALTTFNARDVPAESGFIVFAEPIDEYVGDPLPNQPNVHVTNPTPIVAVSWGWSEMTRDRGVWLTYWSPTQFDLEIDALRQQRGLSLSEARHLVRTQRASLTWDNETTMGYNATRLGVLKNHKLVQSQEVNDTTVWEQLQNSTAKWAHITRAAWLLMTQDGVTDVEELHSSRTQRRRAERDGYNPAPVRVVKIRHRENTPTAAPGDRGYSVRWVVRGHWRNQWYPSRQEHRPVWINPHIKGPQDAPLSATQTVHVLDTP